MCWMYLWRVHCGLDSPESPLQDAQKVLANGPRPQDMCCVVHGDQGTLGGDGATVCNSILGWRRILAFEPEIVFGPGLAMDI